MRFEDDRIVALYELFWERLTPKAAGLLHGDTAQVEDAFHDAFARFLKYLHKGNVRRGEEFPYFVKILKNHIGRVRFEKWKVIPLYGDPIHWDPTTDDEEIRAIVDVVLASDILPEHQRRQFGMVVVLEYELLHARRLMGIGRMTQYRYLRDAKTKMRKIFQALGYEPGYELRPEILEFEREKKRGNKT